VTTQTIVLDLAPDVKLLLQAFVEAYVAKPAPLIQFGNNAVTAKVAESKQEIVEPKPSEITAPKQDAEPQAAKVSLSQIRELINEKAGEQKTSKIVELLGQFGAKNAASLLEDKYSEFYTQLKAL